MTPLHINLGKSSVNRVFRIETDRCKVCEAKVERKRKWIFWQQVFVVHLKYDGNIEWKELK